MSRKKVNQLESSIEESFFEWCKKQGYLCEKLKCIKKGWPDRCVLLPSGKVLWLEFKRPGDGEISKHQEYIAEELGKLGHKVAFPFSVQEAKDCVSRVLELNAKAP